MFSLVIENNSDAERVLGEGGSGHLTLDWDEKMIFQIATWG